MRQSLPFGITSVLHTKGMDVRLKYALVTGSTKGIGYAIAHKLIECGWHVFLNYAHDDHVCSTFPDDQYTLVKADLSTLDGVERLSKAVLDRTETLSCLVLNAGTTCRKPLRDITYEDWQYVMDTNVNMPFFTIQRLFGSIEENGSIVFISSALSIKPHATSIPYGVSKAAVNMLAQNLVKEFSPRGIRVNVICPGFIDTEWQREKPAWLREKIAGKVALRRFGSPEEVAEACMGLIENSYINGAVLSIDGGYDME